MTILREQSNVQVVEHGPTIYFVVTEHYAVGETLVTEGLTISVHNEEGDGIKVSVTSKEMRRIGLMLAKFGNDHECDKVFEEE